MLYLILLLLPFAFANNDDFVSLDFIASAPYTYNHKVGGGAYNDRSIGEFADGVESLEGRQETCFDYVSYLLAIVMKPDPVDAENSAKFVMTFLADSTGQSGVALGILKGVYLNGPGPVENGNGGGTKPGVGAGKTAVDGLWLDKGTPAKILSNTSMLTGPLFTSGSTLQVTWEISGLSGGDSIPVRIDVQLLCQIGSRPTGNLQADLTSAKCTTKPAAVTDIPGGQQTVPFKTVSAINGLAECIPTDAVAPLKGVNFTADVNVYNPKIQTNGGYSVSKFYYSWTSAAYFITNPKSGVSTLHTYDTVCTYLHQGEYLYSQGTCGCESTWIDDAQPQLFYDPNGKYYLSPPVQETLGGQTVLKYTADNSLGTKAVQTLYLSTATPSIIVRAIWADGTVMDFSNVNLAPIPPATFSSPGVDCGCKRRLDIAILLDKSVYITPDAFAAESQFATHLANQFTIGPNNAQFALFQFDDTVTQQLSINDGTTTSNVLNKIDSLQCKLVQKKCGSTSPNIAAAINAAVTHLKTSTRASVATPAIVIATTGWESTQSDPISVAVNAARNAGIAVFVVTYNAIVTPAQQTSAFGSYYVLQRFDDLDLGGTSPDDVAAKVCKLNTKPCGDFCCGVCDTACSTCLPVDSCNAGVPNCVNETVVSGACCVNRNKINACVPPTGTCQVSSCNLVSGQCENKNTCVAPPGDNCYNYACVNGVCQKTLKQLSSVCETITCENGAIKRTPVNCGTASACQNVSCDVTKGGCVLTPIADTFTGTVDPCNPRICDTNGWGNKPVDCPTTDTCNPRSCVNGVCQTIPVLCNTPSNLCDLSKCVNGACTTDKVICTPGPCQTLDPTFSSSGGCNPTTGKCVFKSVICQSSTCMNQQCNTQTNKCEDVPTAGCNTNCVCTNNKCTKTLCNVNNVCQTPTVTNCSALAPDYCTVANPCDDTNGCTFTAIDCNTQPVPTDKCKYLVADPTSPGCCVQKDKNCNLGNPCKTYGCDPDNGCTEVDKCVQTTDKCKIPSCSSTGCVETNVTCTPPNECYTASCDSTTGKCVYQAKNCDDNDACTTDSCENGQCKHVTQDCTDTDVCTTNSCVDGACTSIPINCDDSIACTLDSCDPITGCTHTPDNTFCSSPDPCVTLTCSTTKGCVSQNVTCPDTGKRCLVSACVPYEGCSNSSVTCNATNNAACTFIYCEEEDVKKNEDKCQVVNLVCGAPVDNTVVVATAAALSAAAIAGIIAAVVIFGGVAGGAAVAVARRGDDSGMNNVGNNPLYVATANQAENPLFAN